jgi:hypothetical protein
VKLFTNRIRKTYSANFIWQTLSPSPVHFRALHTADAEQNHRRLLWQAVEVPLGQFNLWDLGSEIVVEVRCTAQG